MFTSSEPETECSVLIGRYINWCLIYWTDDLRGSNTVLSAHQDHELTAGNPKAKFHFLHSNSACCFWRKSTGACAGHFLARLSRSSLVFVGSGIRGTRFSLRVRGQTGNDRVGAETVKGGAWANGCAEFIEDGRVAFCNAATAVYAAKFMTVCTLPGGCFL